MKIALLGYGKMGKAIERIAVERGHRIVLKVDIGNRDRVTDGQLKEADIAIDFSAPSVAVENYKWCFDNGVTVVSGTTGWLERWQEVVEYCGEKGCGFFYASNFSVGVNLFFRLNAYLARLMGGFNDYKAYIEETHHIHKLDAPSGTAITLAQEILDRHPAYGSWELVHGIPLPEDVLPVSAKREGEIPGIHAVLYKSEVDQIEICHSAFSREGFARGAVLAAEFMQGKKGILGMKDMLKI